MQKMREQIEAMKEIWTKSKPEYHGDIVEFDTLMTWPKPVQKPYPPIILGGAFPWAARRAVRYGDGWYPNAASGDPEQYVPAFREMAREAGRDPHSLSLRIGGAPDDLDALKRYRDMGVDAVNVTLTSDKRDDILPVLDRWGGYIQQLRG
jgi:alkanesulfonate monooxygenase SsuD/methylene tetrahydromethanopterin reductase-like flavin-dependent oxidoreductase (luciferase family)